MYAQSSTKSTELITECFRWPDLSKQICCIKSHCTRWAVPVSFFVLFFKTQFCLTVHFNDEHYLKLLIASLPEIANRRKLNIIRQLLPRMTDHIFGKSNNEPQLPGRWTLEVPKLLVSLICIIEVGFRCFTLEAQYPNAWPGYTVDPMVTSVEIKWR